ncbi:TPA: hypothetical protein QHW82_002866 [Klebsiella pneumoniae]|nr:hypothetical protein [Klebsiella pneumoniae]
MTTDITELAQREKFEAWFKSSFHPDKTGPYIKDQLYFAWKAAGAELVEALEKAQQVDEELCKLLPPGAEYMDPPDGGDVTPLEGVRRMVADYRQRIAELESRTVTVKMPKPHAHLIWIQAGHAPDDYWDDVEVSHSEKDRCCDGSERYPVYARWEIEEMLAAAGIKVEAE